MNKEVIGFIKNECNRTIEKDGIEYIVYILGYDLLHEKLHNSSDNECDITFDICVAIAKKFLVSNENKLNKGLYECLELWLQNNEECVNNMIKNYLEV